MKTRQGFVSNSSSASFILTIQTKEPIFDLFEDEDDLKRYLEWEVNPPENDYTLDGIEIIDEHTCCVRDSTAILNDVSDIPQSMKDVYLAKILKQGLLKIHNVYLEIEED